MAVTQVNPGGAAVWATASGGKIRSYNAIDTTPSVVAPVNAGRQRITFHNPGTIDIFVAPSEVLNAAGSAVALTPSTAALGGCFRIYANGGSLTLEGECQGAWQAFSASASGNALTVMDSNA